MKVKRAAKWGQRELQGKHTTSCRMRPEERTRWVTRRTDHSRSLYMIVKKTCKNRFTAFISTDKRYSHASPDIISFSA